MQLSPARIAEFRRRVWDYYAYHGRNMPWRNEPIFYHVLVSEVMLQQTQVSRVLPKFCEFMQRYATIAELAQASLADVLIAWQGLGYNRRAKFLHQAAKLIVERGQPTTFDELVTLPGIGKNTAGAIMAYAYNAPVVFIETNIRSVYIHEFFADHDVVSDSEIIELARQTLDNAHPRDWYYALMDYGAYLKSRSLGAITKSKQYKKQSAFDGSLRQARGMIVRLLLGGPVDSAAVERKIGERFTTACDGLVRDGLVERHGTIICLTAHTEPS